MNAVGIALLDAGIPMKGMVSSCLVGYIDGEVLVDLTADEAMAEDKARVFICTLSNSNKIICCQVTHSMPLSLLYSMVEFGVSASADLLKQLKNVVDSYALQLLGSRTISQ